MTALLDEELEEFLLHGEAEFTERKRELTKSDASKVREAICAFANDLPDRRKPGVVFIGVDNEGACANLPITDKLLLAIRSYARRWPHNAISTNGGS